MKNNKKYFILAALAFGVILAGCQMLSHWNKPVFSGTVEMTEYVLGVPAGGRLEEVKVKEGDQVVKGQILAVSDRYGQALKDLARTQTLFDGGGASQQMLEKAQLAVNDLAVIAPIDGIVLLKVAESGEVVPVGGTVIVLGNPLDQWVKIFVPEGFINQIHMDQSVRLRFDGTKTQMMGKVSFIASKAEFTPRNVQTPEERVTQAFAVKIALDNPTLQIRPGASADIYFD